MFEYHAAEPPWKPGKPLVVDAVIDYGAFALESDCCLVHLQSERAKEWMREHVEGLGSLIWGEALCVKAIELTGIANAMREAGFKLSTLGE